MIQVVHGDEEDIGLLRVGCAETGREGEQTEEQQREQRYRSHKYVKVVAGRTRGGEVWLAASGKGDAVADFTMRRSLLKLASHDATAVPSTASDAG